MDSRLRTSFVPKKTLVVKGSVRVGGAVINPFLSLAIIIFFMAATLAGGIFLYKILLQKQIVSAKADLVKAKEAFEIKTIEEWKRRDNRIKVANELLAAHRIVSPIFTILENATLQTTRFLSFDFSSLGDNVIKMTGEGLSYTSVALLSDSFNDQPGIKNPLFSGLTLNAKGGVQFSFVGSIDPAVVSYKESFNQPEEESF